MSETPFDPSRPTVLQAADVRRTPVLGAAVGCAAAASILGWIERGPIATAIVVALWLVPVTLWRTFRRRFDRHKAIARWTLPIWLYVSVTGVVIYFMLYHWYAPA